MSEYEFPCGCKLEILGPPPVEGALPLMRVDRRNPPFCPAVADLYASGRTKGLFQLEAPLGQTWSRRLAPENEEQVSALVALLRPGCIGGDTKIITGLYARPGRRFSIKKEKIRDIYKKHQKAHPSFRRKIISTHEGDLRFFDNQVINVMYSGDKEVFRVRIRTGTMHCRTDNIVYNLECTSDHKLLTSRRGWVELRHLKPRERVAVVNNYKTRTRQDLKYAKGEKSFREKCWQAYEVKCVMCNWSGGSPDVNHLRGNRKLNNDVDNLCYLCPNHHRRYSEGTLDESTVRFLRQNHTLPPSDHIKWVEFMGAESVGIKDTYDITVVGPNHNFVAGNFVVHNCLQAKDEDGVSMTERYVRRKRGAESTVSYHPVVDACLDDTYNIIVYQEQAMQLARDVAQFNLQEADNLRKSIGKKLVEEMAKVRALFIEKAREASVITPEQAEYLFDIIEKSARYSFNRAHSLSYARRSIKTAYIKAHFPHRFFAAWLRHAGGGADGSDEITDLVDDARSFGVTVKGPDLRTGYLAADTDGVTVWLGLAQVKKVGVGTAERLLERVKSLATSWGTTAGELVWEDLLYHALEVVPSDAAEALMGAGAFSWVGVPRRRLINQFAAWQRLSGVEAEYVKWLDLRAAGRLDEAQVRADHAAALSGGAPHETRLRELRKRAKKGEAVETALEAVKAVVDEWRDRARPLGRAVEVLDGAPPKGRSLASLLASAVENGFVSDRRKEVVEGEIAMLLNPPSGEADLPEVVAALERKHIGCSISLTRLDGRDISGATATCAMFRAGERKRARYAVELREVRKRLTKKGDEMASMTVADLTGVIHDTVVFPDCWSQYAPLLRDGNTVLLEAEPDKRGEGLVILSVTQL